MLGETSEKIAVVGIGCRLPPAGNSLATFWKFLLRGGNALRPIRRDRWDWRQFYDADPKRPGKSYAPKAAMLDADIQQFDPLAFGMSPREAAALDPQQRLLLESAWEAFEDAGLPLERLAGSRTGVFIGGFCLDHLIFSLQPSNRHLANAHTPGGVMMTVLSNRLSHAFDLRGPSLTLDTACSSSLVALHYACQSLLTRESEIALAGGVNVMTRPEFPMMMSKGHFLSHHGECHTFDETAAGYARGEGAGVLVLRRLSDALAAGDPIHAVVRATGVNQDGHTDGISLPNSAAQEALVREVYARAGVDPAEVDYVEAHGTGTQAGDPAELGALDRHFSPGRVRNLLVGSVKTNIGHLEAAAGVAGVIKAIGVLKHRQVPKNLHFKRPNPRIPFADYRIEIPVDTRPLPGPDEKPTLFASVNSFGYGGANAHAVLESAPARPEPATSAPPAAWRLLPFSARSEEALRDLAGKYAFLLGGAFPGTLDDLAHTLAFRRSHLPVRAAVLAENLAELREKLIATSTGQPHDGVVLSAKDAPAATRLAFVYTGMGPQWWGMGQELFRHEPLAAATLDEVDAIFAPLAGWSLKAAMLAPEVESRMARTEVAQPANFALQLALTRLWAAWGVTPAAVIGHSVGEVTAAHVAGVYTLEEAVRVSYHRSRLQQTTAGRGAMLAVGLAEAEAAALIADEPTVSIAAINSFSAVTLSGETEPLQRLAAALEARGVFQKFLRVEVAYHSPQMDPIHDEILAALADLAPQPARLPLYSTAEGAIVPGETWTADYWWRNVRQPVRFAAAMQALFADGFAAFLEVGPHPVLGNSIKECAAHLGRKVAGFTSLRRAEPERARLRLTLAELYAAGAPMDWPALAPTTGRLVPAPPYPWQRQTHWIESERSRMDRLGLSGPVYLNRSVPGPRPAWEVEVNRNYFPFLPDHGLQDQTVFPGMGYVEAAITLAGRVSGRPGVTLENISFERVLVVDAGKIQILRSEFDPETDRFEISCRVDGEEELAVRQCRGRFATAAPAPEPALDLAAWREACPQEVSLEAFYGDLSERGLFYGPAFRPTTEVRVSADRFFLRLDATAASEDETHPLHPTLFDAAIQPVLYCSRPGRLFVPFSIDRFRHHATPPAGEIFAVGRLTRQTDSAVIADVWLTDPRGRVLARAGGMACQSIDTEPRTAAELHYALEWRETPAPPAPDEPPIGADVTLVAPAGDTLAADIATALPGVEQSEFGSDPSPLRPRVIVVAPFDASPADAGAAVQERWIALLQKLAAVGGPVDVTLVTRSAQTVRPGDPALNTAALGLAAVGLVAQNETDALRFRAVDLAAEPTAADAARVIAEVAAGSRGEIALRDNWRLVRALARFRPEIAEVPRVDASVEEPLALTPGAKGRLDQLCFSPVDRVAPRPGEIEVRVLAAGVNAEDLLRLEGREPTTTVAGFFEGALGREFVGVVQRTGPDAPFAEGDRVLGLAPGVLRTWATVPATFVRPAPAALDARAAVVPLASTTAERALFDVGNLRAGERLLVAGAAHGAGLAAVELGLAAGAEVFALADNDEQRQGLLDRGVTHALLPDNFVEAVRALTRGDGVDVVFGALSGGLRRAALDLLRAGGRYLETSRRDLTEDRDLSLRAFERNLVFASVDLGRLAIDRPDAVGAALDRALAKFGDGTLRPPAAEIVPGADFRRAFLALTENRPPGGLALDLSTGAVETRRAAADAPLVRPDGAYLVTGGTSGFGVVTARWLAARGAGRIVLASRSGARAPGVAELTAHLRERGSEVEVIAADVSDPAQAAALLARAATPGKPLRGIIHGAMVLDDALLTDLPPERFRRVFAPKAIGALNLAAALAPATPPDFVVFHSSISSVIGNRGQTSYVAANALLDGLAHQLRARGVPAVSINWGALAEAGVVARDEKLGAMLSTGGITGLTNAQALAALETALRAGRAQLGAFLVDWSTWLGAHPKLADDPRFRDLRSAGGGPDNAAAHALRAALASASPEERLRALEDHLRAALGQTLKMAPDAIPTNKKINELGVDSLLVLELSLGIEERVGARFAAMEFLKGPTLEQLAASAARKLWPETD